MADQLSVFCSVPSLTQSSHRVGPAALPPAASVSPGRLPWPSVALCPPHLTDGEAEAHPWQRVRHAALYPHRFVLPERRPTANSETTRGPCRTVSEPSASTRPTAKPTAGWGEYIRWASVRPGKPPPPRPALPLFRSTPRFAPALTLPRLSITPRGVGTLPARAWASRAPAPPAAGAPAALTLGLRGLQEQLTGLGSTPLLPACPGHTGGRQTKRSTGQGAGVPWSGVASLPARGCPPQTLLLKSFTACAPAFSLPEVWGLRSSCSDLKFGLPGHQLRPASPHWHKLRCDPRGLS